MNICDDHVEISEFISCRHQEFDTEYYSNGFKLQTTSDIYQVKV
jgi:hypothetical protein